MAILKKGLLGAEDFYTGTDTTFTRVNSTGGTSTLTKASYGGQLVSPVVAPNPLAFDVNLQFKGPNPWLDVTRFGARGATPFSGTATMSAGSTIAMLAAAGNFLNGDGVVIYGAGATNTMSTPTAPTVTPSLASGATGTSNTVASTAAATTYNYQIVLRDKNGGLTAASAVGSTTTGLATLGSPSVSVTSLARANNTVTVTTASAHDLVVGAIVYITGSTDATFSGYYQVATAPTTTTFTYIQGMDTRAGASASATGGTCRWYVANKLTLPAYGANGWQYLIYGRTGGSLTLIGVSRPLELTWEDYGATFMAGISLPTYYPSTPPSAATNDWLSTTIVSGGGTTTLTLANASTNAVTAAVIKYDDAPGILAAANAAVGANSGVLYFPASKTFTVNSYLTLPGNLYILQRGILTLNETVQIGISLQWHGGMTGTAPQFASISANRVEVATAHPGVYFSTMQSSQVRDLTFQQSTNQGLIMLTDGGSSSGFEQVNFQFGVSAGDYMGMAIVMRGGFVYSFRNSSFINSGPATNGISTTPVLFRRRDLSGGNSPGKIIFREMHFSGRGIHQHDGATISLEHIYTQAMRSPLLSLTSSPGTIGGDIRASFITTDTSNQPVIANWTDTGAGAGSSAFLTLESIGAVSNEAGGVPGVLSGKLFRGAVAINSTAVLGQNRDIVISSNSTAMSIPTYSPGPAGGIPTQTGNTEFRQPTHFPGKHNLYWDMPVVTNVVAGTPTAGGTVPIGSITYKVTAYGHMGGEGNLSLGSTVTTDASNRTVPLTWTGTPGAKTYSVYRQTGAGNFQLIVFNQTTTSYTDTGADFQGNAPAAVCGTGIIEIGVDNNGVYRIVSLNVGVGRLKASLGTALVAGDFALSGWGAGAAVSTVTGTDQGCQFTVTAGTGPSASPTVTLTFKDLTWTLAPICQAQMEAGTGTWQAIKSVPTATTNVMTYNGTPVDTQTYVISMIAMGR